MVVVGKLITEIVVLYFLTRRLQKGFARLFYRLTRSERITSYLLALLFLPGTFVHEMAHFLTALFLLVPVGQMELIPEIDRDSHNLKLGSVPIAKTDFVRRTLIGVAPIVFGFTIIIGLLYYTTSKGLLNSHLVVLGVAYIVFEIANTMFLSRRDLEGSWKFLILVIFLVAFLYLLGMRVEQASFVIQSSGGYVIFEKAAYFLAIPVLINVVFVSIFRYFKLI